MKCADFDLNASQSNAQPQRRHRRRRRRGPGQRTVQEFSAGGLVVDGLDRETQAALLIGKADRRGRVRWTLPKGHIEIGERPDQTAVREIAEETGIRGDVLAALGSIDYWFRAQGQTVHKTVHHYLLRCVGGEPCTSDHEVDEVAWVALDELASRLTHPDEREIGAVAVDLVAVVRSLGAAALPPLPEHSARRQPQPHSVAGRPSPSDLDASRITTRGPKSGRGQ